MTRSINKAQSDILLNKMQNNKPIACSFVKVSKEELAEFWKSLTEDLNSAGPPIKNVTEWKKVWADQKRYVRGKAANNIKNLKATGGGPNQTRCLTETEQFIYELVGMKESVEGLENSAVFGLPGSSELCKKRKDIPEQTMIPQNEVIEVTNEEITCLNQTTPPRQDLKINEGSEKKAYSIKRKRSETQDKLNTSELIAKEVKTQENLYSKICEIAESSQKHNKETETMMRRVYRSLEKSNDLKEKELEMLARHHAACEQQRFREVENKIEKNKRILEIEEMKLKLLEKNASQ